MADRLERKMSPRLLPKISSEVDFTSLDHQAVDVFLASFSSTDKANVTKHMTKQLKALRALLSFTDQLSSQTLSYSTIQNIMAKAGDVIGAEKLFVLDLDHQEANLVVSYSQDSSLIGVRTPCDKGMEALVLSQKKGRIMNDLSSSTLLNIDLYKQLKVNAKNIISVPIILGDTVLGLLMAFNKNVDDFNFSNFDISCLETIAVYLAMVSRCAIYSKATPSNLIVDSPTSITTQSQLNAEYDNILKDVIDDAYRLLGADRISVFVDNGCQELLCICSQDMKGLVIPSTVGFIGECFHHRIALNIPNVKSDARHYKEMDHKLNYETRCLISVPLIGVNDEILGVMQAVNKMDGQPFAMDHLQLLLMLGQRVAILLSRIKGVIMQKSDPNVTIVRNLGDFSLEVSGSSTKNLAELIDLVKKYGRHISQCDDVYYYSATSDPSKDELILERVCSTTDGSECKRCQGEEVHPKIREAHAKKLPTEAYFGDTDDYGCLIPGISARTALIIPLGGHSPSRQKIDLLIITRQPKNSPSISFAPEDSAISLENVFIGVINSHSYSSFSALETQGLISLANIFSSALHSDGRVCLPDAATSEGETAWTVERLDSPNVLSTFCAEDQKELSLLFDWNFNVLNMKDKNALHYAVVKIFDKECNFAEMDIDREIVYKYIVEVDKNYLANPFHNFSHAVCVTHFDYMLLSASNAQKHLSSIMIFSSLLSALVHDVAHPGNTNMYEINMRSDLAILYNDTSVLENHHCSTAFRLMNKPGLGIFNKIEFAERAEIRKMMIACIIATDMHYHVSLIELISNRASQDEWHIDNFTERMNYGKILLHAADLSNPTRVFKTSRAWAERVSQEFNAQGKLEKENGIPVSTFLLSHDLKSFVKNELFFSGHIVFPMWKELIRLYPSMSHITDQITSNLESWKSLIK